MYPQSLKNIKNFPLIFFIFYNLRKIYILHGRVFIMVCISNNEIEFYAIHVYELTPLPLTGIFFLLFYSLNFCNQSGFRNLENQGNQPY